jgi:hypothetical protein
MMALLAILVIHAALGQAPMTEPEHAANPVYQALRTEGFQAEGATATFPEPILHDGQTADAQRAACIEVAGSEQALDDLLRNSVTAPFKLKIRNIESKHGVIRAVDLWFAVHTSLDEIKPDDMSGREARKGAAEVGNMRFEGRLLTVDELKSRGLTAVDKNERYFYSNSLLLDRIGVETTSRTFASRSEESFVAASRTSLKFDADPEFPNRWRAITRRDGRDEIGSSKPYAGGASYVKVSPLKFKPGTLLVEVHAAFDEPKAWFDGAPILRSKISLVAQDRIRELRREIAKRRKSAK